MQDLPNGGGAHPEPQRRQPCKPMWRCVCVCVGGGGGANSGGGAGPACRGILKRKLGLGK